MGSEAENGSSTRWGFRANEKLLAVSAITVRGVLNHLMENLDPSDPRPVIPLGHGDPSCFPCFRSTPVAEDASAALYSAKFNGYSSTVGIPTARRAIADYLSKDLSYKLSPDDIYETVGCGQAIEVMLSVLAQPSANILLPRPGFPVYEAWAALAILKSVNLIFCQIKDGRLTLIQFKP